MLTLHTLLLLTPHTVAAMCAIRYALRHMMLLRHVAAFADAMCALIYAMLMLIRRFSPAALYYFDARCHAAPYFAYGYAACLRRLAAMSIRCCRDCCHDALPLC